MTFDVVVPTVGRASLARLLSALAAGPGPLPGRVLVGDDRRNRSRPLPVPDDLDGRVETVPGRGAGPAAARNLGWRRATAEWVAFLDDDVVPGPAWVEELSADLEGLPRDVAASQGRVRVPMPAGRRARHLVVAGLGLVALGGVVFARRGGPVSGAAAGRWVAGFAGAGWLAGTVELALARVAPGPRNPSEVATMAVTSVLLPPVATWHWLAGWVRLPRLLADRSRAPRPRLRPAASRPAAVLLDRDGTLVVDVPYNGDPGRVVAMPGAREAVGRLRAAGVPTAVVSNQSGVARGYLRVEQVEAVNRRVEELLGPLGPWLVCLHGPGDGCGCRKPAPGLIEAAARALEVDPADCVVIGDIGADVEAARAAGARAVLVPTAVTRGEEVAAAPEVAADLEAAVELLLGPGGGGRR
jgi:histidinol-phosphate phosphatase family protein